ncbi:hypothetical protein BGZ75_009019 [Mortierella antarctica]|nr:hypothetical protein BGZ75_009019 [Mortierella antarctica]
MDEHEAQEHQDSPSSLLPQESSSTEAQQDSTIAALSDASMEQTAQGTPSPSTATATELQDAPDTVSKEANALSPDSAAPDSIHAATATALEGETDDDETHPPKTTDATYNDDFGDFGDFGSAEPGSIASATAPGGEGEDDFDGFSAADPTLNSNDHGEEEDDDGFGDFGEVQAAGADDDDEFGDFNDFAAAGGDDFQDSGDFGDFAEGDTVDGDDPFGAQEPVATAESQAPVPQPPVEQPLEVEIAPDFSAVNSRQVENYVLDRLSELYPLDGSLADSSSDNETLVASPQLLNPDLDSMDTASILSDQALWTSLCETSFLGGHSTAGDEQPDSASSAPQFQWKHSVLRREYYASLGLVIAKEQASVAHTSIPHSALSPTSSRSKVSSPMIVSSETMAERKPLDLEATRAYCQFTKENLGGYSGDEMKDIIARLTELTQHASEELTHWLDQREQMNMDSERYNEMIASLVGRAAKLKDAESKQNTKTKRITRTSFNLK